MQVSKFIASKAFQRLPPMIKENDVFKHIKKIEKPFKSLGLSNSLEKCEQDFDGKPAYIGFTGSDITGIWDIATMSMRGVSSCMHWKNTHAVHLVGSVTDPFLGMVYITDNERTPYGISFRRRALVRLVYNTTARKSRLIIERIYKDTGNTDPSIYNNKDPDCREVHALFRRFLESKVEARCNVVVHSERRSGMADGWSYNDYIPRPTSVDKLSYYFHSMSDCGLGYATVEDPFLKKFANQN